MDTKELVLSARKRTRPKAFCQAECDGFRASEIFSGHVTSRLLLFPPLISVLRGHGLESAQEVTRALTKASRNGFQESLQNLYERWQQCHCQRWKCHVNICTITCFSSANQFRKLLESMFRKILTETPSIVSLNCIIQ
jgi:hypothetical protein